MASSRISRHVLVVEALEDRLSPQCGFRDQCDWNRDRFGYPAACSQPDFSHSRFPRTSRRRSTPRSSASSCSQTRLARFSPASWPRKGHAGQALPVRHRLAVPTWGVRSGRRVRERSDGWVTFDGCHRAQLDDRHVPGPDDPCWRCQWRRQGRPCRSPGLCTLLHVPDGTTKLQPRG